MKAERVIASTVEDCTLRQASGDNSNQELQDWDGVVPWWLPPVHDGDQGSHATVAFLIGRTQIVREVKHFAAVLGTVYSFGAMVPSTRQR